MVKLLFCFTYALKQGSPDINTITMLTCKREERKRKHKQLDNFSCLNFVFLYLKSPIIVPQYKHHKILW